VGFRETTALLMATDGPSSNPYRRALRALLLVEVLHYLAGIAAFIPGGVLLLSGGFEFLRGVGQGIVQWRDVDKCLTALAVLAYGTLTCRSASFMGWPKKRQFSLYWAWAHVIVVPALPLALLTWLVLSRRSVKQLYESRIVPFEPLMLPPPLPIRVIPLEGVDAESAVAAPAGGAGVA